MEQFSTSFQKHSMTAIFIVLLINEYFIFHTTIVLHNIVIKHSVTIHIRLFITLFKNYWFTFIRLNEDLKYIVQTMNFNVTYIFL